MDLDAAIAQAETALRDLTREWERFLAGERPTPPQPQRVALERRLRLLEDRADRSADRFRIEQVQNRFMTYVQHWERQLRAREEGNLPAAVVAHRGRRAAPAPNVEPVRPVQGANHDDVYARYVAAKKSLGVEPGVDRESFLAKLEAQRVQLEAKLGSRVSFDVVVEGGKVKLAARRIAPQGDQG